jgi:hypothetical protein
VGLTAGASLVGLFRVALLLGECVVAVQVKFSRVDEWLQELASEGGHVEDSIVRLTYRFKPTEISFISNMYLMAGFVTRGRLVYVRQLCGQRMQSAPEDEPLTRATMQRSRELAAQIETAIAQYGLQQRAGVFESVERVSPGA